MNKPKVLLALCAIWFLNIQLAYGQGTEEGTLTAAASSCTSAGGARVTLELSPEAGSATIVLSGTWAGTVEFQGTADGKNYDSITGDPLAGGAGVSSTTATGTWIFNVASLTQLCVRASTYTSGTVDVKILYSRAFARNRSASSLNVANLNNTRYANHFAGANAGAKIAAAIANLPSTGGTVNACGFEGAQTITSDMFTGITKPGKLLLCAATFTMSATQNVPDDWEIEGIPKVTLFSYTGTGKAFSIDAASGAITTVNNHLKNFKITTSTGVNGVYIADAGEWSVEGLDITGFSGAGILLGGSGSGGTIEGRIANNTVKSNGYGLANSVVNIHNAINVIGNIFEASTVGAGIWLPNSAKGWQIIGNVIESNTSNEIITTNAILNSSIIGNWFETNTAATNGIQLGGACPTCTMTGLIIEANGFFNNAASATGRALLMGGSATAPGFTGIIARGNDIRGYGNTTNPAIDFGGKTFANSDFSGNYFASSVTTTYGNLPAAASTSTIVNGPGRVAVTFSATPTFNAILGNLFEITLTDNVTSSTLSNAWVGEEISFLICQDATGSRTFVWPTNVKGGMTIGATLSTCSAQIGLFNGTNLYMLSSGVTGM